MRLRQQMIPTLMILNEQMDSAVGVVDWVEVQIRVVANTDTDVPADYRPMRLPHIKKPLGYCQTGR